MKRYLEYWLKDMDSGDSGLSEWMSAPHTGMDNQHERAGHWRDRFCKGVDLNSYLVRECRAFARIARRLGYSADAGAFVAHAEQRNAAHARTDRDR